MNVAFNNIFNQLVKLLLFLILMHTIVKSAIADESSQHLAKIIVTSDIAQLETYVTKADNPVETISLVLAVSKDVNFLKSALILFESKFGRDMVFDAIEIFELSHRNSNCFNSVSSVSLYNKKKELLTDLGYYHFLNRIRIFELHHPVLTSLIMFVVSMLFIFLTMKIKSHFLKSKKQII